MRLKKIEWWIKQSFIPDQYTIVMIIKLLQTYIARVALDINILLRDLQID